jgi:exonuclease SbcD
VAISGNHDSATRLTYGGRFLERCGVHVRTAPLRVGEPALVHEGYVVHALPYLEPAVVRTELAAGGDGHRAVLGAAMDRVRADLARRGPVTSVVVAHSWVNGGAASDSERDISVGGVGQVGTEVFEGAHYVALGHLHRPQAVTDSVRYSGSLLPYSFSEAGQDKVALVVDLEPGGVRDVREVLLPRERDLVVLRGELAQLLQDPTLRYAEQAFVSAVLTDTVRPTQPMAALQRRFPHAVQLSFAPAGVVLDGLGSYGQRVHGRTEREVIQLFVQKVRGSQVADSEVALLDTALEQVRG